jgi:hypothetical protein
MCGRRQLGLQDPESDLARLLQVIGQEDGGHAACADYRDKLDEHGLICSMSRKGDCWDNAVSESFFKTLKVEVERVNDRDYWTRE